MCITVVNYSAIHTNSSDSKLCSMCLVMSVLKTICTVVILCRRLYWKKKKERKETFTFTPYAVVKSLFVTCTRTWRMKPSNIQFFSIQFILNYNLWEIILQYREWVFPGFSASCPFPDTHGHTNTTVLCPVFFPGIDSGIYLYII